MFFLLSLLWPVEQALTARYPWPGFKKITITVIIKTAIWRAKDALANRMQRELSFYIM